MKDANDAGGQNQKLFGLAIEESSGRLLCLQRGYKSVIPRAGIGVAGIGGNATNSLPIIRKRLPVQDNRSGGYLVFRENAGRRAILVGIDQSQVKITLLLDATGGYSNPKT